MQTRINLKNPLWNVLLHYDFICHVQNNWHQVRPSLNCLITVYTHERNLVFADACLFLPKRGHQELFECNTVRGRTLYFQVLGKWENSHPIFCQYYRDNCGLTDCLRTSIWSGIISKAYIPVPIGDKPLHLVPVGCTSQKQLGQTNINPRPCWGQGTVA